MMRIIRRLWCWLTGRCPVDQMSYEQAARRSAEVRARIEAARTETRAITRTDRERHS